MSCNYKIVVKMGNGDVISKIVKDLNHFDIISVNGKEFLKVNNEVIEIRDVIYLGIDVIECVNIDVDSSSNIYKLNFIKCCE